MTCVCAVANSGRVVVGGDSALSNEDGDRTLRSPKVFEKQAMVFGVSGEMWAGQLPQHVVDVPAWAGGDDAGRFVVREFCGRLQASLREHAEELLPSPDDDDELWQLLIGVGGRLFRVCSHLSVSESAPGYDAIGPATPQALGSLASTEGRPARERVEIALSAAERHHGGVAAPFTILEV